MVGGPDGRWIGPLARSITALVLSRFVGQDLVMCLPRKSSAANAVPLARTLRYVSSA